jgi:cystathionine gamma-synthase/methionine-gamma-lyase
MKLNSIAVHAGDRKRPSKDETPWIPVTTPIYTAASFFYESAAELDQVLGMEKMGQSYARYNNPSNDALEELVNRLEGGFGALACSTGMSAIYMALAATLVDRPGVILAANLLYGATLSMLSKVFELNGAEVVYCDFTDEEAVRHAIAEHKPSILLMETIANPTLRVPPLDRIAKMARDAKAPLIVDNTFATPMTLKPIELGAHLVVHSLTKYLNGHGDTMGGVVVSDEEHYTPLRVLSRTIGCGLGPFEAYQAMRGIKTFPLRFERQCSNAREIARWLARHPAIERVIFPENADHPDAANIARLFTPGLYGGIVTFQVKDAGKERIFRVMDALRMLVPASSLGDVHSMVLYPAIASHRDLSPKHRLRLGIPDSMLRLSVGIESAEDIIADLDQALRA